MRQASLVRIWTALFLLLTVSVGCLSRSRDPSVLTHPPVVETTNAFDGAGISAAISKSLGDGFGQIVTLDPISRDVAQAVVTITQPIPDVARVYLVRRNETWGIERIERQIRE